MPLRLFIILMFFLDIGYAYLDPITGTMIIQVIVAAVAATVLTIKTYWIKIKAFIFKNKIK
tara:strand:+ start:29 stop:211 length:183 start_codon:yes stop_codon:yes gene_type:complete